VSAVSAAAYRGLLAEPALRRLAIADAFARLPQGMVSLTVLLVAAEHASMAVAGLVVAGYTLGQAVTGPVRGRLADRYGLTKVAASCSVGYAVALLVLLGGAITRAPAGLLIGAATTAGLVNPPLSPGMRSLWSARAGGRFAQAAFALDAAVFDLACYAGGLAVLTAAGLYPPLLAVAAPLAGLFLGPVLATLFSGAAAAAPSGSGTETQAWLNSIMNGGAAAGAAAAGALLGSPVLGGTGASRPVLALALACALALGAAVSAAVSAAVAGARTLAGHAPGPFGRNESSGGGQP
jgi:predicted MFS family arabinose efflux permease